MLIAKMPKYPFVVASQKALALWQLFPLKAWYLEQYEPIRDTLSRSPDLRLSRNSLLKSGMRADFLEEKEDHRSCGLV